MADLVTLAAVKSYLAIVNSNQDALIEQLIPRESRLIEQYTSRRFPSVTNIARRLNGTGTSMLVLPDAPILSVELLQIDGVAVPASADGRAAGYTFDETAIYLTDWQRFPMGRQNVTCSWTAGYESSETDFVPTDSNPTLTPHTDGEAAIDAGVIVEATGAALTRVGSSPVAGEYTFAAGTYTFNSAQANALVRMTYRYVPGPIAQACIELVGLDLKQRDNIGINSKSMGQETITYSDKAMSASVRGMLNPYRRLYPA